MAAKTVSIVPTPSTIERLPTVKERTGLSRSTLYKMMSEKKFPAHIRLGERAIGWRSTDIDAWIASRSNAA